jgi:phage terminase Nu1 subunit (DNA packaging protein)
VPSEYDSEACIAWLVQREVAKVQGESPRDRLARLQADEVELKLAERRGLLVAADQVEPMWAAMVGAARSFLRGEVTGLAQLLQHAESEEAKRDLLAETFDEFLRKLSGYDAAYDDGHAPGVAGADAPLPGAAGAAAAHVGGAVG